MNDSIAQLFIIVLYLLTAAVVIRSLLSWFPVRQDNEFARILYRITEPLMDPIRRVLPRTGLIDLSGLVLIILLQVMIAAVRRTADA